MKTKKLFRESNNSIIKEAPLQQLGQNTGKIARGLGNLKTNIKQAASNFKQGFQQGVSGQTTAAAVPAQPQTVTKKYDALGPVDNPNRPNIKTEPQQGGDVAAIKQQLTQMLQSYKTDQTRISQLEKQVQALQQKLGPTQSDIDADRERLVQRQTDSVIRTGSSLAESIEFFRR